jgi:uncharacterized protein (TIRG00374 family)
MKKLHTKVFLSLAFAALVYIVFAVWSNLGDIIQALQTFRWQYLPLIIGLTFCNYLFRFQNWQYYLKTLGVHLPRKDSFLIYIAGFSMSITPGKVGEIIRSFLLKEATHTPLSKTLSLTFVDRITDLSALVLIIGIGAVNFHYGQKIVWVLGMVLLAVIAFLTWRKGSEAFLRFLTKFSFLKKQSANLFTMYESAHVLLVPQRIIVILILSLLGWGCEALGFYVTFLAFGIEASVGAALFIYAFSTVIGAISLLPGGLGLTEGSMAGLLLLLNVSKGIAGAATLVIRACTLWFGVLLGALFLIIAERRFRVATLEPENGSLSVQ